MKLSDLGLALAASVFAATANPGHAESPQVAAATSARIAQVLKERYPTVQIEAIHPGPIAGLYEIVTSDQLLYSTEGADLIFVGRVIDTQTKEDLSVAHWNQYNGIDFSKLPFDLAIKIVKGDGSRTLALFEDPRCPYCKELEQQMQKVPDVTLYVFLYPLEEIHPGATAMADRIWCSQDRAAAWSSWMLNATEPGALPATCDISAIGKLGELGGRLRINSTPTLFFSDGRRARGAMSAVQLETGLAQTNHRIASKNSP
jgi:thiol:disulfide interchange protein DsbC